MSKLNKAQYDLLQDYARFIRGQNSKTVHTALRIIGGAIVLASIVYTSLLGIAIGLVVASVSFLGNRQLKHVEAALAAADTPHKIQMLNLDIKTELWENNVNYYVVVNSTTQAHYKIQFVPVGKTPEKGQQMGTGYFTKGSSYPALIALDDTMIIPSKQHNIL